MDFLWEEEWWTQQRCKKHHSPSLSQGKNYPLSFHQMRTGEDANIFRLPTIQSLQVFGKSSRKESGREKAKQEHKRAKVFHATPQPASPLAARLGSREGRHCPPLSLDHGAGFSYVLFPWWPGNICFLFKSDGGGSGGTCITSHCTLGGESLASPWRSLSHTGEKKNKPKPNQKTKPKPTHKTQTKISKEKDILPEGTRDHIKPRGAWSDLRADPAVSRTLDQRPPEAPSCLNYPVILQKKSEERLSPKTHFHHTGGYWSLRKQH